MCKQCLHGCTFGAYGAIWFLLLLCLDEVAALAAARSESEAKLQDADAKFTQLKAEAKAKIKALREEVATLTQQVQDVEKGSFTVLHCDPLCGRF